MATTLKIYTKLAESVVESLADSRMDIDRFLPALHQELLYRTKQAEGSPDDYDDEERNYWANQAREAKLHLEGIADALSDLDCAIGQVMPGDDQIIAGRMKSAAATLRNLKRRMDA